LFRLGRWRSDGFVIGFLGETHGTKPLHILSDGNILGLKMSARFRAGFSSDTHALGTRELSYTRLFRHRTRFLLSPTGLHI
jgi:hypothetical protein